jgi:hypothetical protein
MVLPDGARTKRIPALSWDSVVESPDRPGVVDDTARGAVDASSEIPITLEPLSLDLVEDGTADQPVAANRFESTGLEARTAFPSAPSTVPLTTPSSETFTAPSSVPTPSVEAQIPPAVPMPPSALDEPPTIRTTPPAVVVPAIGDVTSGPERIEDAAVPASEPANGVLPEIREATAVAPAAPLLPSVVIPASQPAAPTPFSFDPASVAPAPTPQPRRQKRRGAVKLVATFVVLGAIVVAGVVFGQDYLFPREWDDTTVPYAEAVEAASDVEFTEPLSIIAESTDEFATQLQTEFASVSPEELSQWRALGLASGTVDDTTLAMQLSGWQDAVYATRDAQVYHDAGAAGPSLDAVLVQEMAVASLDQQFGWSSEQSRRGLDAAATTYAEVLRQARVVQQASEFAAPVPSVPAEVADTVPPVIGYRMLAPQVYAEFDAALQTPEGGNPLAGLGSGGPGILGDEVPVLAPGPTTRDGDVVTAAPVAMDRSFWFLVFAGYLDSRSAYDASEAVVESALTATARGDTPCVAATFAGAGVEQTEVLRSALTSWSAAAPAALASSFEVLPDGTLQLVSCDPGPGFDAAARPGVARELIGWRTAELATMEAVVFAGGGEANFEEAWPFVAASPIALDVAALPSATAAQMAATATEATFDTLFGQAG